MRIEELNPDEILASLLSDKVEVQTSETQKHTIVCYADNKTPSTDLGDEFISVILNGPVKTVAGSRFSGNIALTICCKLQDDSTAKTNRIRAIVGQCRKRAMGKRVGGFIFRIDPSQVITPTTPNLVTGYSSTVINVEWRVI